MRPHQNWRGQFARGTWGVGPLQGRSTDCAYGGAPDCIPLHWPGYRTNAWHQQSRAGDSEYWMGSLVDGMRDATGQIYMRNRYYDPATGQFTQPDPIGIAGGLNTYGFAAGDPVSYSDPYGLCPWWMLPMRGMCRWFDGFIAGRARGKAVGPAGVRPAEIEYAQDNPLRAYTAYRVAQRIFTIVEDMAASGEIYGGIAGLEDGPADAIRHAAWSCHLAMLWGEDEALIITGNHEDPQPATEEGKSKKQMDTANNATGARIGARQRPRDGNCVRAAQDAYSGGQLRVNTLGPRQ